MNPTLAERLQLRRRDPYWRAHPPALWGRPLELPVALQVLAPGVPPLAPVALSPAPVGLRPAPAPSAAVEPSPGDRSCSSGASSPSPSSREWILLLAIAVVWLLEGWSALRQLSQTVRPWLRWPSPPPAQPATRRPGGGLPMARPGRAQVA